MELLDAAGLGNAWNLISHLMRAQTHTDKCMFPSRQESTGETLFLHALVHFELLGYLAFHTVFFHTI